jgi:hypothetical protein
MTAVGTCGDDRGRAAVYAAEEAAFGGTTLGEPRPLTVLRARAGSVVNGDWWRRAGGPPTDLVSARPSAGSSSARSGSAGRSIVRLAAGQLDELTVAHELAHLLAGVEHGHGERFRVAHVDVVAVLAGSAAAGRLAEAYRTFGLALALRTWPPPVRAEGDTFVIVP